MLHVEFKVIFCSLDRDLISRDRKALATSRLKDSSLQIFKRHRGSNHAPSHLPILDAQRNTVVVPALFKMFELKR